MSVFADADRSSDPSRLVDYLDLTAQGLAGMKHYVAATLAAATADAEAGCVLDIGCGAGHDLDLLRRFGVAAVGIDLSRSLLTARNARCGPVPLAQAAGEQMPFRDGAFAGCRIERVLQHVAAPADIIAEAARCLRRGGVLAVFEPDWSTLRVETEQHPGGEPTGWFGRQATPDIGGRIAGLSEAAGIAVSNVVTEHSVWNDLDLLDRLLNLDLSIASAVNAGRIEADAADHWLDEQRGRQVVGRFRATVDKILVVGHRGEHGPGRPATPQQG